MKKRLRVLAVAAIAGIAAAGPSVVIDTDKHDKAAAELPTGDTFAGKKTWTEDW